MSSLKEYAGAAFSNLHKSVVNLDTGVQASLLCVASHVLFGSVSTDAMKALVFTLVAVKGAESLAGKVNESFASETKKAKAIREGISTIAVAGVASVPAANNWIGMGAAAAAVPVGYGVAHILRWAAQKCSKASSLSSEASS
jgi:hypothetical protein